VLPTEELVFVSNVSGAVLVWQTDMVAWVYID
jgi:hypothetical protein